MRPFGTRHAPLVAPLLAGVLAAPAPAAGEAAFALPDTFAARVAALAAMADLDAAILGSRSATAVLDAWCRSHARQGAGAASGTANEPRIVALRVAGAEVPASAERRRDLRVGPDEPVRHRRVRLSCGDRILSEADNWYVPSRLTPEMNATLDATDVPFGRVVAPLKPQRRTLRSQRLWLVLPEGWETQPHPVDHPERPLSVPPVLFEHSAILLDGEDRPIAEVEEHYTRAILSFAPPL